MTAHPSDTDKLKLSVEHIVLNGDAIATELTEVTGLRGEFVQEALCKGAVWHGARASAAERFKKPVRLSCLDGVVAGDKLFLNYDADVLATQVDSPVLISDQLNYSFWFKPYGVYSQGTRWGDHCSMPFLASAILGKPVYLVHRLDRAASGLMILAHTRNALKKLTQAFADRKIKKTYRTEVHGYVDCDLPLIIDDSLDGKKSYTKVLKTKLTTVGTSVLTVEIATGRKHQIRRHLASIQHPIVGDRLYDPDREHQFDLQLSAVMLALRCPFTSRKISVDLPLEFISQRLRGRHGGQKKL